MDVLTVLEVLLFREGKEAGVYVGSTGVFIKVIMLR